MTNIQVYDRPKGADRSPWVTVALLAVAILVVLGIGAGIFFYSSKASEDAPPETPTTSTQTE